jgi:5-methylcytosine-specific restriction endonuclease McrA
VIRHSCLTCGALIGRHETYCGRCRPRRDVSARGGGRTITAFREAVLAAARFRCELMLDGKRCEVRGARNLEAHHVVPVSEGGANTPDNGRALCRQCHALVEGRRAPGGD